MDSGGVLRDVRKQMRSLGSPRFAESMQRFFREPVRLYGIPAPQIRKMAAEVYRSAKHWSAAERNRFCHALWKSGMSEEGVLAVYLYRRFARQCHECEFRLFERWIDRYVTNWGHCDAVAVWLVGASIGNEPQLAGELAGWTRSANRWKRRAAAVALMGSAGKGEHTEVIFAIAEELRSDPDEMVQKGVGWLLKETYPKKPKETVRFLRRGRPPFPRLVLRYAAEKMTAADRKAVLAGQRAIVLEQAPPKPARRRREQQRQGKKQAL